MKAYVLYNFGLLEISDKIEICIELVTRPVFHQ